MKNQIDLVDMPALPDLLSRDITFQESRTATDLQVLFSYCTQHVMHDCRSNPKKLYNCESGQRIVEFYLDPETENQPIAALENKELIARLADMLDAWLIQEGKL